MWVMVNTRMEGRVENVEKDIEMIKLWMIEMKESLTRIEERGKRQDEVTHGVKSEAAAGDTGDTSRPLNVEKDPARFRKLEIPLFTCENPIGWLFKLERYFSINAIEEPDKLEVAVVCLEDKALNWFQWLEVRNPVKSWSDFKRQVKDSSTHKLAMHMRC